jgi:hypothetical protein
VNHVGIHALVWAHGWSELEARARTRRFVGAGRRFCAPPFARQPSSAPPGRCDEGVSAPRDLLVVAPCDQVR